MILLVKLAEASHRDLAIAALKAAAPRVTTMPREKGTDLLVMLHDAEHRTEIVGRLRAAGKPGVAAAIEKGVWFR